MSKRSASTLALTPQQQAKVARFRSLSLIKPPTTEAKKSMTSKAGKGGGTLSFLVEGLWTAKPKFGGGGDAASTAKVTPTVENTKLIGKWLMPDQEEIDRVDAFGTYVSKDGNDRGITVKPFYSPEMKSRANGINAARKREIDAEVAKRKQQSVWSAYTDDKIREIVAQEYGDDVTFDGTEELSTMKSTFLTLPKADDCDKVASLLHIQPFTKITFYNVRYNYSVLKGVNSSEDYAKKFTDKGRELPDKRLPYGRARAFFNASSVTVEKISDETLIEALRLIDETHLGLQNAHVTHWVPDLVQLRDMAAASTSPQANYHGPIIQRFQSDIDYNRMVFPEGMVSRIFINEEKLQSGKEKVEFPTLDMLCTVLQWRLSEEQFKVLDKVEQDAAQEAAAQGVQGFQLEQVKSQAREQARAEMSFDEKESKSVMFTVNLTGYGKHESDAGKPSQLEMCPLQDVSAWKKLAQYYFKNVDMFAQYKVDISGSVGHPANNNFEDRLAENQGHADFNSETPYVLKTFVSRLLIPFVELTETNCVPLSLEECKAFSANLGNVNTACDKLQSPKAMVRALNNMEKDQRAKYFVDEKADAESDAPRYEFYALLPVSLNKQQRDAFAELVQAYRQGYKGPLGGVLLNENYTSDIAADVQAHPVLVEKNVSALAVTSEQLANSMYLLVVDRQRYNYATKAEKIKSCQRNMFGMFKQQPAVAVAAAVAEPEAQANGGEASHQEEEEAEVAQMAM